MIVANLDRLELNSRRFSCHSCVLIMGERIQVAVRLRPSLGVDEENAVLKDLAFSKS